MNRCLPRDGGWDRRRSDSISTTPVKNVAFGVASGFVRYSMMRRLAPSFLSARKNAVISTAARRAFETSKPFFAIIRS